jgi:translation initiation factor 2B subunit (eIF-2B alpha/beta/delta family)
MGGIVNTVLDQAIATIAANNHSGAVEIAEQGAAIMLRCARTSEADTVEGFRHNLLQTGWLLIQAQPTMAPLVNLVNMILWKIEVIESVRALREAVAEVTNDFKRRLSVHQAAIAESVLLLIPDGAQILTNGRSTTVLAALRHAQRAGRRFRVVCAEGRPGCEGRAMASKLAEDGIPVTFVVDALAIAMAPQAQLLLVGADHLMENRLANKIGTYGLVLAARAHTVPVYALCSSEKFLPPGYRPPPQTHWPAEQVWPDSPANIAIENLYFDHTPLSEFSGIVTERGVLTTAGIEAWLAATALHPALRQAPK